MRFLAAGLLLLLLSGPTHARIESAYSEIDTERDCVVFAAGEEGHWSNLVCAGYKGYPVFIYYSDARESLFYGFPPQGDLAPPWESFRSFNHAGPRIEWRIERAGEREEPFATIHRWFVEDPSSTARPIEVLVVEKVGRIGEWQGCAVGYVVATGNPGSNVEARRIADEDARTFACGKDKPAKVEGAVPVPALGSEE